MKKIITILLVLGLSLNTYSQSWEKIFSNDKVLVETSEIECNPNNKLYPYKYLVLKYTNLTDSEIDFNFNIRLWYNDKERKFTKNDEADEDFNRTIKLAENSSKQGSCTDKSETFKVFYKHTNPKMNQKLTKIAINETKTK